MPGCRIARVVARRRARPLRARVRTWTPNRRGRRRRRRRPGTRGASRREAPPPNRIGGWVMRVEAVIRRDDHGHRGPLRSRWRARPGSAPSAASVRLRVSIACGDCGAGAVTHAVDVGEVDEEEIGAGMLDQRARRGERRPVVGVPVTSSRAESDAARASQSSSGATWRLPFAANIAAELRLADGGGGPEPARRRDARR